MIKKILKAGFSQLKSLNTRRQLPSQIERTTVEANPYFKVVSGSPASRYINLGCGGCYHPDWTNVDCQVTGPGVIAYDLTQGIPFPDESFSVAYHSHLLEHLPKSAAEPFLRECYRVLQPSGTLRVAVPDLEQIARLYLTALEKASQGDPEWSANYEWILLEMYDQVVRDRSGGEMLVYLSQKSLPNEAFVLSRLGVEGEQMLASIRASGSVTRPDSPQTPEQRSRFVSVVRFINGCMTATPWVSCYKKLASETLKFVPHLIHAWPILGSIVLTPPLMGESEKQIRCLWKRVSRPG